MQPTTSSQALSHLRPHPLLFPPGSSLILTVLNPTRSSSLLNPIISHQVGAQLARIPHLVRNAQRPESSMRPKRVAIRLRIQALQVQRQASDMRTGHGRSAHGHGAIILALLLANVAGHDIHAGSKDVDDIAKVGKISARVLAVDCSHRKGADGGGGGDHGGWLVLVAGCHDGQDAFVEGGVDNGVEGFGAVAPQRHVDDGGFLALFGDDVLDGPFETVHYYRVGGLKAQDGLLVGVRKG